MLTALLLVALAGQNQTVSVKNGDTVVYRGAAPLRIVHRTEGNIRAIYNAAESWLVLLVDVGEPGGAPPDGRVDVTLTYDAIEGVWPLGERWEGHATIDEYSLAQGIGRVGVGITTATGTVQMFYASIGGAGANAEYFRDPKAIAKLMFDDGSNRTSAPPPSFDEAERDALQYANIVHNTRILLGGKVPPSPRASSTAPVRAGGNVPYPKKIVDARPAYPADAQAARAQGVVILEITVGADGSVRDARILRGIPLLDQAAIDCVKQWKYEPTVLNGVAVPVITTATVNFTIQ